MAIFDDDAEMDRLVKYFSRLKVVDDVPNIDALIQSFSSLSITDHLVVPLTNTIPTTPVNSPQPIHIHPQSPTPPNTQEDLHSSQFTDSDKHEDEDDCHTDSDYDNYDDNGDDDKTIELNSDEPEQDFKIDTFPPKVLQLIVQLFFPGDDFEDDFDNEFILEGGRYSESYTLFNELRDEYHYIEMVTEEQAIGLSLAYCDEYSEDDGMWYFVRFMGDTIRTWHVQIDSDEGHVFFGHVVDYVDEAALKCYGKVRGEEEREEEGEYEEETDEETDEYEETEYEQETE